MSDLSNYVAMDCEMVEIEIDQNGKRERKDMLGRVSIVDHKGKILLDKFVKPQHPVCNYRTPISGIDPSDMENGEDFLRVQNQVKEILKSKVLIGHSLEKDLGVLKMGHPLDQTKDLFKLHKEKSLKDLALAYLKENIQVGPHDSVLDAKASMGIYLAQRL